jgi:hypothetical protein
MKRYIERKHPSDFQSMAFQFHNMNDKVSKFSTFKSHNPNYYNANHNFPNSSSNFPQSPIQEDGSIYEQTNSMRSVDDPIDSWLQSLRAWVEIKRSTEEPSFRPMQQPYFFPYTGAISQPNMYQRFQPPFRMEDLETIGYKGYVCKGCLTAHLLAINCHRYKPGTRMYDEHCCNNRRKLQILQGQQKENETLILENLHRNLLVVLILVRRCCCMKILALVLL